MKSIEILALGIRLVGIYFIIQTLKFFAYSYNSIQQWGVTGVFESTTIFYIIYGVAGLVFLLTCFFLIRFPVTVAGWLLPRTNNDEPLFNGSISDLSIAAFTILGVYILSWAIPDFFYNAGTMIYIASLDSEQPYNISDFGVYIVNEVVTVLEIGIGLYLCLKAKGLYALIL